MIHRGDCLTVLPTLPAGTFQTCITSPPYWALRDYGTAKWEGGNADCQHEGNGRFYTEKTASVSSAGAFSEAGPANAERLRKGRWRERGKCVKCGAVHTDKQIGMETTPEEFIETMVAVFREVRRVLRDDGTLWLNLGDSYNASPGQRKTTDAPGPMQATNVGSITAGSRNVAGLAAGQLLNIPNRVAAALQADGWIWRSTIIWSKRSPMPEAIHGWRWVLCRQKVPGTGWTKNTHPSNNKNGFGRTDTFGSGGDNKPNPHAAQWEPCNGCEKCRSTGGLVLKRGKWRPTTAHEYVFLFSKSQRYFADGEACKEPCSTGTHSRGNNHRAKQGTQGIERNNVSFNNATFAHVEKRNPRSVWTLSSAPYKAAHFATFPPELVWRCLNPATSAAGCCPACGTCLAPVVEHSRVPARPGLDNVPIGDSGANRDPQRHVAINKITGYRPACSCPEAEPVPCKVLDPFSGSGTVGQVCASTGREFVGIELNPAYIELANERISLPWAPKELGKKTAKRKPRAPEQMELFK